MKRHILTVITILALWATTTAPFVCAADPPPEVPLCRRDGSARVNCRLAWIERAQRDRIVHALGGDKRIVTFYGSPLGPGLGILGDYAPETMLARLRAQAEAYQQLDPDKVVIPAFHMVTTVADGYPGEDEDYNHRLSHEVIREWIDWAAEENVWVILDVQPGRGDPLAEIELLEPFLYEPHVQLAVDPEFIVGDDGVPGQRLGSISGETINQIQARLDVIARQIGMTKVLIIHQFEDRMVIDKDKIQNYWTVELVWDADGFGGPGSKIADYHQYRNEPGFEKGGLKIFYKYDAPLIAPEQVMKLAPVPSIIVYQ
ncbi:MAG TPA: hypothetical protein VIK33_06495 [Anaerolineae bacterium]